MTDLTNLTAKELEKQFLDRIMVSVRNPEWREICRRLEELEQLKLNYAASESLRQQVNDDRTKELIIYQKLRERLEECEALNKYAQHTTECLSQKEVHIPGMIHYETDIGDERCPPFHWRKGKCTCGYDAARAAVEE